MFLSPLHGLALCFFSFLPEERKRVRETGSYPVEEKSPGAGPGGAVVGRGGGESVGGIGGGGGGGGGGPPQGPDMHPLINSTSGPSMTLISDALAAYTFIAGRKL